MTTSQQTPVEFPFRTPSPFATMTLYGQLRAERPLVRVRLPTGDTAWLVTRHADNRAVLADPRFSRAAAATVGAPRARAIPLETGSLTTTDPPEHTRLRKAVVGAFTAHRIETLRPTIARAATELVEAMLAAGPPADVLSGLAEPLAVRALTELLGVDPADLPLFRGWIRTYLDTRAQPDDLRRAAAELHGHLARLVATRRQEPGTDLLSALATAEDEDRLTDAELVTLGVTLLVAGYQTVSTAIASSVLVLLQDPAELGRLLARPALLDTAVEELLRYVPAAASGGTIRVALSDVDVAGTTVRAGEAVIPACTSANRDPAVFADPDRLDLSRQDNPHLAFGHGVHRCLGAALARMELTVALLCLFSRFPGLRLAEQEIRWAPGGMIRGPLAVPVVW